MVAIYTKVLLLFVVLHLKIKIDLRHSLLKQGVFTCFTNYQISPLNHYDRDEKSSVTGEL
jgi:hypothetical protein